MKRLKVTLEKSTIGRPQRQRDCVRALGLRKINDARVLDDTAAVRGIVGKVLHLVRVEDA